MEFGEVEVALIVLGRGRVLGIRHGTMANLAGTVMAEATLAATRHGDGSNGRPVLVLMHFLGGSQREWDEVLALLGPDQASLTVDLPGFGGSAGVEGYSVGEMAEGVEDAVRDLQDYVLVGHSMSGKVAAVLARRAEDRGDARLRGLVLVAPSPPGPEPMAAGKREQMLASLGYGGADDWEWARRYITKNEERDLTPAVVARATAEVLRMDRAAWRAWVTEGSREDWAERVGVLGLPALVVAGAMDRSLGPVQQREHTLPHLAAAKMCVVEECSHLVPMEKPGRMAELLREFVGEFEAV